MLLPILVVSILSRQLAFDHAAVTKQPAFYVPESLEYKGFVSQPIKQENTDKNYIYVHLETFQHLIKISFIGFINFSDVYYEQAFNELLGMVIITRECPS